MIKDLLDRMGDNEDRRNVKATIEEMHHKVTHPNRQPPHTRYKEHRQGARPSTQIGDQTKTEAEEERSEAEEEEETKQKEDIFYDAKEEEDTESEGESKGSKEEDKDPDPPTPSQVMSQLKSKKDKPEKVELVTQVVKHKSEKKEV